MAVCAGVLVLLASAGGALGAVTLESGDIRPAPGGVAGKEVTAACWQQGVRIVEGQGFGVAELGQERGGAVMLRGAGRSLALVPLGSTLCAIEIKE